MAKYFEGRKYVGSFVAPFESGRSQMQVNIFEKWQDADASTTVRCGTTGQCVVERSRGLNEKSSHTLKGVIESTLGFEGVLSLKTQVEETLGHEVTWNVTEKVTKTFPCTAPKCGRCTLTIYELVREHELSYWRQKQGFFYAGAWDKKWTRTLVELTNNHDGLPDIDPHDPMCNCPEEDHPFEYDGRLCFDFGSLSFRVPYRLTEKGFDVQLFERVVSYTFEDHITGIRRLDKGLTLSLPSAVIPEALRFLGELDADQVEAQVSRYIEPEFLPSGSTALRVDVVLKPERIAVGRVLN